MPDEADRAWEDTMTASEVADADVAWEAQKKMWFGPDPLNSRDEKFFRAGHASQIPQIRMLEKLLGRRSRDAEVERSDEGNAHELRRLADILQGLPDVSAWDVGLLREVADGLDKKEGDADAE